MKKTKKTGYGRAIKRAPYLFLLPNILIFSIFVIIPLIMGLYYSFTDYNGVNKASWVSLDNYIRLFNDQRFLDTMIRTFIYVFLTMVLLFAVSLGLALLLQKGFKGIGLFRASFYWPSMISAVVVGVMWKWVFNDSFGVINTILRQIGQEPVMILSNPKSARIVTVLVNVWSRCGYYMIIFLNGLLSIPEEMYEASSIDGANNFKRFHHITLPLLRPTSLVVIMLGMIEIFKTYPLVENLTGGGPARATTYIVQFIYETGFEQYKHGYASAMSMILFVVIAILSGINFKIGNKED